MNEQQHQQEQQQLELEPMDPANQALQSRSAIDGNDQIALKLQSLQVIDGNDQIALKLQSLQRFTMVLGILVVSMCGILLYGTFFHSSNSSNLNPNCNQKDPEEFRSKLVQLLVEGNAQRTLKNLQNDVIDELRAIVEQQAKKLDELHANISKNEGIEEKTDKKEENRSTNNQFWIVANIISIFVITMSAISIFIHLFVRPFGWDIRKWSPQNVAIFFVFLMLILFCLLFPFISLYLAVFQYN